MPGRAKPQKRPRRQPEVSRNAILQAALVEFGQEGLAGARMDAIAEAAEVNKALLYYYFKDKEALYGEILDRFFKTLAQRIIAVCNQPGTAGRRFLSYARTHFDAVAESPYYAHIFMGELMSAGRGGSTHLDRLFAKYMKPIGANVQHLMQEGIRSGEFRAIDPNQFLPSAIGSIVHYFLTAPLREKFMPERFPHPQVIQKRRAAVLDFIAAALFTHRPAGIKLAAQIAQLPDEEFRSQTVRKRKLGKKLAVAPPSAPAPKPVSAENSPNPPSSPSSTYTWLDRTFPDFETAIRIMKEEARLGTTPRNMLPKNIEDW